MVNYVSIINYSRGKSTIKKGRELPNKTAGMGFLSH
jgi:hypothetical protein